MNTVEPYSSFYESCVWIAVLLPLISFVVSSIIREQYAWLVSMLAPVCLLFSLIAALYVGIHTWNQDPYIVQWSWFHIGSHQIAIELLLNNLSVLMLMIVSGVSFLIHLYSLGYMAGDAGTRRYFAMLGLFTFSMLGIVVSGNLFMIFIFWELVGFSSYMLIGHWQHKPLAAAAAKKAFLFNRIGDAGFLIGLMIVWANTGTFSLIALSDLELTTWNSAASFCIFCGVIGKSAQFPLLTWLPEAMEGPTPVSALIHAATMVAAGVFLLSRVDFLFTPQTLMIVTVTGIVTALLAALAALVQTDMKKVLAYSTISQLGLMVTAAGAGAPEAAILHLFTHAFFKACLFLCAGSVIHALHRAQQHHHVHFDVQDIRNLGGLRRKLPFTFLAMAVSGSALAGLPFFSGFISKEAIFSALNVWKGDSVNIRWIIFALAFVVSALTVLYTFRLITKVFLGEEMATQHLEVEEPPYIMRVPVFILATCSLWIVAGLNPFTSGGWLMSSSAPHSPVLTIVSIVWIVIAFLCAYVLFRKNMGLTSAFLKENFYFDFVYRIIVVNPVTTMSSLSEKADRRIIDRVLHATAYVHVLGSHLIAWVDRAIIDGSVNGVAYAIRLLGSFTRSFQGGKIQVYVFWTTFTIIIFLIWSLI